MRMLTFSGRNVKEILRDPLNLAFGLAFPLVLLFMLGAMQANVPFTLFDPEILTPSITVFSLAFITMFSATLIAKDRSSSLLQRLYTTPLRPADYIMGYVLPIFPLSLAQCLVCYIAAMLLGLKFTSNTILAILALIPAALFFISLGLLCGSVFTDKQVGGICGGLLTNLTGWLSGMFFELELLGGTFKKICYALPFVHAVKLEQAVLNGNFSDILPHLLWVSAYAVITLAAAVLLFLRQMKRQ